MYRRIKDLREDHDLPQREVARLLNMSQTGYSKYETGENDVPTAILMELSLLYDVSVDYILGMTDEKQRYPLSCNLTVIRRNCRNVIKNTSEKNNKKCPPLMPRPFGKDSRREGGLK